MMVPYIAFDIDGTALKGNVPYRDVIEGVKYLRSQGVEVVFTTNNSFSTASELDQRIFPHFGESKIYSSLSSLRELLYDSTRLHGAAFVIGSPAVQTVVEECNYRISRSVDDEVDVVVVTYNRDVSFEDLETASLSARNCSRLVAANRDSDFLSDTGLKIACGPLVSFVEAGSKKTAEIFGKPSERYSVGVSRRFGTPLAVVGDTAQDGEFSVSLGTRFIKVDATRSHVNENSNLQNQLRQVVTEVR